MQPNLQDYVKHLGNQDEASKARYEVYLASKRPLEELQQEIRDYFDNLNPRKNAKRPRV